MRIYGLLFLFFLSNMLFGQSATSSNQPLKSTVSARQISNKDDKSDKGFIVLEYQQTGTSSSRNRSGFTKTRILRDMKFKVDDGPFRTIGKGGVFLKKYYKGNRKANLYLKKYKAQNTVGRTLKFAGPIVGVVLFAFGPRISGVDHAINPSSIAGTSIALGGTIGGAFIIKSAHKNLHKSVKYYNQGLK